MKAEEASLMADLFIQHYNFSDYDGLTSEECKNRLSILKNDEQELIKSGNYILVSSTESKKEINNNVKQLLCCFNSECDNILLNVYSFFAPTPEATPIAELPVFIGFSAIWT